MADATTMLKSKTEKLVGAIGQLPSQAPEIVAVTAIMTLGDSLGDALRATLRPNAVAGDTAFMNTTERILNNAPKATALIAIMDYLK